MRMIRTDGDIYKSNPLVEAFIRMNTIMGRIFTLALLQVYPDLNGKLNPTDFETVTIPAKTVKEICSGGASDYYQRLKKAVNEQKIIIMTKNSDDPNVGFEVVTLFEKLTFDAQEGLVFKFNKELIPYVLDLNGRQYTRIAAKHIFALSSNYAVRILELLLEYKNIDQFKRTGVITRKVDADELRWFCGIKKNQYPKNANLIRLVVNGPIKEINTVTPFRVWYETIRSGRNITGVILKMVIPVEESNNVITAVDVLTEKNIEGKKKKADADKVHINNPDADARKLMISYGVGKIVAGRLAKAYSREHIINNVRYSLTQEHRINNMGAYIAKAIKEDYYSTRGNDVKSTKELAAEYKSELEKFLEKYGLPKFWSIDLMDDNKISANRTNLAFQRIASEKGFILEDLIISIQKRQIPEPPKPENIVKYIHEPVEVIEEMPQNTREYPKGTDLERKLNNFWIYQHVIDSVRDNTPLSDFDNAYIVKNKNFNLQEIINEAKEILSPKKNDYSIKTENNNSNDTMTKLQDLASMYKNGLIDANEFKAFKQKLLLEK